MKMAAQVPSASGAEALAAALRSSALAALVCVGSHSGINAFIDPDNFRSFLSVNPLLPFEAPKLCALAPGA